MPSLRWGASTNPGRVRTDNEDTFVAESMLFAVADGMGGHQAGEVASALAASILRDRLGAGAESEDAAVAAVMEVNAAIHGAARANAAQTGMGTTLTALAVLTEGTPAVESGQFVLLNVGDSRTYRFRHGRLQRVTVDHSYVQELVATGHITVEEARTHPRRNIVTRALGIEPSVRADMWTLPIVRGDRFVLCSDGLVDEVPDQEILDLVASVDDPQQLADQLIEMANRHGGRDNVTVVVVDVLEGAEPPDPTDEMSFDPSWAEGEQEAVDWAPDGTSPAVVAGAVGAVDGDVAEEALAADDVEITVVDLNAMPTKPPPALPLPPQPPALEKMAAAAALQPPGPPAPAFTAAPEPQVPPEVPAMAAAAGAAPSIAPVAESSPQLAIKEPAPTATEPVGRRARSKPRRRFTIGVFLFIFLLAAVVTVTFTLIAVHARSGYFVGFDGDTVVIFKGQQESVLWFEPTVEFRSTRARQELEPNLVATIDGKLAFDTAEEAAAFIDEQVIPTTTTTVPESTTTTTTAPAATLPGEVTTSTVSGP